jgi:hypothetical protein
MKRTISIILGALLFGGWIYGQEPERFTGKFDTQLVFDTSYTYQTVFLPDKTRSPRFAPPAFRAAAKDRDHDSGRECE